MSTPNPTGSHADRRFPKAESDHACNLCRQRRHEDCPKVVLLIGGDGHLCECFGSAPQEHEAAALQRRREQLTRAILDGWSVTYGPAEQLREMATAAADSVIGADL